MRLTGIFCLLILSLGLISCASKKGFSGKGDICGMIIDEKNCPVEDFVIKAWKDPENCGGAVTNEKGIFLIENLSCGNYKISGFKEGFSKIDISDFGFSNRSRLLCFQINSCDSSFQIINQMVKAEEYEKAFKNLWEIYPGNNLILESVLYFYSAWIQCKRGNKTEALADLKKCEKNRNEKSEFSGELQKLKEMINEIN